MLLSSVILVLQETLEVALLVSVLLTISYQQWSRLGWVLIGIGCGLFLSVVYAAHMLEISAWFDYVGQEVVNACLQITTMLLVTVCSWSLAKSQQQGQQNETRGANSFSRRFMICAMGAVALTITREGSEVLLYLGGFWGQGDYVLTVMSGSSIGFSIGLSTGILLYYGLSSMPARYRLAAAVLMLALFAGNMLSQATQQLTQADWVSWLGTAWDSSGWLPENSIFGQLLYALIGYEATPSLAQVLAYGVGVTMVLTARLIGHYPKGYTRALPGTG